MFEFREYCLETYVFILETWSWCQVSESVHRLLAHSWEMIVLNNNFALLSESEQGSEAGHKEERYARQHQSRKCDLISGDIDSFRHKWAASDPGVRSLDRMPWCSVCRTDQHWTRGCTVRKLGPAGLEDEVLIQSFFCSKDCEPADQQNLITNLWD